VMTVGAVLMALLLPRKPNVVVPFGGTDAL
jgi:hypothetical protein